MLVRPIRVLAITAAALALVPAAAGASATKIELHKTQAGKILVDSRGYTIYAFTKDKPNKDACAAVLQCLSLWPAVTTKSGVVAGRGVKRSLLGTIKFRHGRRQVTYAGHPLYTYAGDTKPGQTSNINILQFGGRWPALNAAGKLIT
jgi:predicted lipoprotein with Yx(FWY)xxD motif